jgi:hypothetical protein
MLALEGMTSIVISASSATATFVGLTIDVEYLDDLRI